MLRSVSYQDSGGITCTLFKYERTLKSALEARVQQYGTLACADLRDADLCGARLARAYLSEAQLQRADLTKADLRGANLYRAVMHSVNLTDADLSGSNLAGADLSGACLFGVKLLKADLTDTRLPAEWIAACRIDVLSLLYRVPVAAVVSLREALCAGDCTGGLVARLVRITKQEESVLRTATGYFSTVRHSGEEWFKQIDAGATPHTSFFAAHAVMWCDEILCVAAAA